MMNISYFACFFSAACLLGCEDKTQHFSLESSEKSERVAYKKFLELELIATQKYAHVLEAIEKFLEGIETCPEKPQVGVGWCEFVEASFTPKTPTLKSLGQRILVIDSGMRFAGYTRYKSRVLDDLAADEDGNYRSVQKGFSLAKGELEVLSHMLDEQYPGTPAIALQRLIGGRNIFPVSTYSPSHGDRIFGTLADLNPDAEFVIAEVWQFPTHTITQCNDEQEILANIGTYLDRVAASLVATIQKYDLNFVNMSFGDSLKTIEINFAGLPNGSERFSRSFYRQVLQLTKVRLYDRLFALRDVVFVQAGPWSDYRLDTGDLDYLIDCAVYPNRIRVGGVSELSTDISSKGEPRRQYTKSKGAENCIDMFFNSGVVIDEELMPVLGDYPYLSTTEGIGTSFPSDSFSSSWATPFVLSYLNFKKQEAKANGAKFSISHLHNSRLIIEPVKYAQFEIFRTGRL